MIVSEVFINTSLEKSNDSMKFARMRSLYYKHLADDSAHLLFLGGRMGLGYRISYFCEEIKIILKLPSCDLFLLLNLDYSLNFKANSFLNF